jgi:hypothetical protein
MGQRLLILLAVLACFLGLNINLWSQSTPAVNGIRGYLDPHTGIFHSMPHPDLQDADVPPPTTFGGKFVFNFTITVSSALPSTTKIFCEASVLTEDVTSLIGINEDASVAATRSGSTATCTVTIPYSWNLSSSSSDRVSLSYSIIAGVPSTTVPLATRTSGQSLPQIKVPANGATTTETIAATI